MTKVIVKISIPKVKTAVLTNLQIFGENSSHKASVCSRGGGLKRYLADFHLNSTSHIKGLPSLVCHPQPSQFLTLSSVSTLYSVAHFGVLIYTNQYVKDICWHLFVFLQWYRKFFHSLDWLNNQTKTLDKARNK